MERVTNELTGAHEKDIELYIMRNPHLVGCHAIYGNQVPVGLGFVDVMGVQKQLRKPELRIFEIKHGKVDCKAIGQLARYIFALSRGIRGDGIVEHVNIQGCLVGCAIDPDARILAIELGYLLWTYDLRGGLSIAEVSMDDSWESITDAQASSIGRTTERLKAYASEFMARHGR